MRDKAKTSLRWVFDDETLVIIQNPRQGVETKLPNSYRRCVQFDEKMFGYHRCRSISRPKVSDPKTLYSTRKARPRHGNLSFQSPTEVEAKFWPAPAESARFQTAARSKRLPYYPPHTFRHLAINLASGHVRTERNQAVSQNFGHELWQRIFVLRQLAPLNLQRSSKKWILRENRAHSERRNTGIKELLRLKEILRPEIGATSEHLELRACNTSIRTVTKYAIRAREFLQTPEDFKAWSQILARGRLTAFL